MINKKRLFKIPENVILLQHSNPPYGTGPEPEAESS